MKKLSPSRSGRTRLAPLDRHCSARSCPQRPGRSLWIQLRARATTINCVWCRVWTLENPKLTTLTTTLPQDDKSRIFSIGRQPGGTKGTCRTRRVHESMTTEVFHRSKYGRCAQPGASQNSSSNSPSISVGV